LRDPPRNEIRLGGLIPDRRRVWKCTRKVISEFATLVRKFYSDGS